MSEKPVRTAQAVEPQVWLIGGTSESAELAIALSGQAIPYVVSVTTAAAKALYPPTAQVHVGKLTLAAMKSFARQQQIGCILDASHPFACEVSQQAIALAESLAPIDYLRYERSDVLGDADSNVLTNTRGNDDGIVFAGSINSLLKSGLLCHQRVLFTLGYRSLAQFVSLRQTSQLFARILPSADAIAHTLAAGFAPAEIVALRPPVSFALEKALWQQWKISCVVAKASGRPGGEDIKRQVAVELGIRLVLIQRPFVSYPRQTNSAAEAISFCERSLQAFVLS